MLTNTNEQEVAQKPHDREVILSVNGVSKKFCRDLKRSLFYGVRDIASELLGLREKNENLRPKEFWALKDVSFQLRRGEALGLVGKNGSGKSTLLRIIAGLIKPDTGSVEVKGRLAPLIALGAGFNPILTGRENIYAHMSILGLSGREIDERFDRVVEFAEIGDAIDAPVQTYSSGMAARLGFASAIHTEPDILLIDEVLAVGDIKFRAKCQRRLAELRQKGTSFVLVSHQAQAILNVCTSAVYLAKGNLIVSGDTNSIVNQYEEDLFVNGVEKSFGSMSIPEKPESESLGLDITHVFFRDQQENIIESITSGEPIYLCVGCKAHKSIQDITVKLAIRELAGEGNLILLLNNFYDKKLLNISSGDNEIRVWMPYLGLRHNFYTMRIVIAHGSLYTLDFIDSFPFRVRSKETINDCSFYQPRQWQVVSSSR